ncbi:hypothetical protein [Rubrobacter aplysinae]|uniref:hypothetical protein n=1 Tax=Rubrobacter aplysinae TaxID=909625 RepID=UPI00064C1866|nr:hypothetical protein [Rubrobacter aplysinae]
MKSYLLMLAQIESGGPAGVWDPAITFLEILVGAASTLGILLGALVIMMNPADDEKRVTGVQTICGSAMGLAIALLAVPLFNLFDAWMTSD